MGGVRKGTSILIESCSSPCHTALNVSGNVAFNAARDKLKQRAMIFR